MSINSTIDYKQILLRHEPAMVGKDMDRIEKKEKQKARRSIERIAGKITELVIPRAIAREEEDSLLKNEEKRRQKNQTERELLLLKLKGTQDEKLLVSLPEDGFYYSLYIMYIDAAYVKEKYRKQLSESIKRAKHIGRLRSFAVELDEIELLLACLPEDERKKMIAAIRKNTAMMFDRPKKI